MALSHYSQNPESPSNVYFFASLPLELIQYNYDLGDCNCSKITPLSLLPNIHTCRPGSNGSKVAIGSITYIKNFLTVGFPHCLSQTTLYSDMEGCNWLSNMGKVVQSHQFIRNSEDENPLWSGVEQCIISAMYGSSFFLSRLLMVFTALSIYLLLQKIAWAACCVGDTIFGCKLLIFMGWIWGSFVRYNFLKHPCLAKIDFVRGYLRRTLSILFTYFDIPGVIINNK